MRAFRVIAGFVAAMTVASGMALAVAPASFADSVWQQAEVRAGQEAGCPTTSPAELAAGWTQWGQSWHKWPFGNTGGWVCTRSIVWARDSATNENCVQIYNDPAEWLDFANGPVLTGTPTYSDYLCTVLSGERIKGTWVLADSQLGANAECAAALFPGSEGVHVFFAVDPRLWACGI